MQTVEQVREAALALTDIDREHLIEELIQDQADALISEERQHIETTLQSRLDGPFVEVDDVKKFTRIQREKFRKLAESLSS